MRYRTQIALVAALGFIGIIEAVMPVVHAQKGPIVYAIGKDVSAPVLVRRVEPEYTPDARKAQIEGEVILEIIVLDDGTVGDTAVVRSLDSLFGLDQQARRALRLWRFKPGLRNGKPVSVRMNVSVEFSLRK